MTRDVETEARQPLLVATDESLESFHDDVQYLWSCSDIPVYENPPSALDFLRNHVAVSKPCIIRNSIPLQKQSGSAASASASTPLTMTLDDMVRLFQKTNHSGTTAATASLSMPSLPPLCVDVTPDGHGDCLRNVRTMTNEDMACSRNIRNEERVFVKPLETTMNLSDFCRRLRKGRAKQQRPHRYENDRGVILDKVFESSSPSVSRNRTDDSSDGIINDDDDDDSLFEDCVLYYSRQNDCLRQELSPMWDLKRSMLEEDGNNNYGDDSFVFPRSFPWADEAFFGMQPGINPGPDAVNLWMGDERAVSAMHKDHYENLFYVLSGEKVFGLCPPSDAPFLYEREFLSGRFEISSNDERPKRNKWSVVLDREEDNGDANTSTQSYSKVHWIATDLFGSRSDNGNKVEQEFPLSKYAHPVTVKVRAGELLYLPSLWFHRVTQTRETVGINYWYDMNFESPLWCYFHMLQQLRPVGQKSRADERDA